MYGVRGGTMARKTNRADDMVISITEEDIQGGAHTVGAILDERGLPRKGMKKLFHEKLVLLEGHRCTPETPVRAGDTLRLQMMKEAIDYAPIQGSITILYEDEDLLIVDKPKGMTVNSGGQISLANLVAQYFKDQGIRRKIRFLNRLDRDTTGCIVICKSHVAQSFYQQQMETNQFEKWYTTVVEGRLFTNLAQIEKEKTLVDGASLSVVHHENLPCLGEKDGASCMDKDLQIISLPMKRSDDGIHYEVSPLGVMTKTGYLVLGTYDSVAAYGNNVRHLSVTDRSYASMADVGPVTSVLVRLYTGKTHQIRVAFSYLGYPLVGDTLYGAAHTGDTFMLRSLCVAFTHMRTGKRIVVHA